MQVSDAHASRERSGESRSPGAHRVVTIVGRPIRSIVVLSLEQPTDARSGAMISDAAPRDDSGNCLRDIVTQAVCDCLNRSLRPDAGLIRRLLIYERTARHAGLERQTIQVIESGLRLLCDRRNAIAAPKQFQPSSMERPQRE
jgi:hypothetical protein